MLWVLTGGSDGLSTMTTTDDDRHRRQSSSSSSSPRTTPHVDQRRLFDGVVGVRNRE